nr:PAS domain-containing protein [uncultured Roseococcus sp.]
MNSVEGAAWGRNAKHVLRLPSASISPALIIGAISFAACALGIVTRPSAHLAMIWPANAVVLGLLVRLPDTRRASVWLAAAAAYMAADLIAGTDLLKALLLNAANLCGIGAAYLVYQYLPENALRMREPVSALYLVLVSAVAAAVTGLAGALADPFLLRLGAVNAGTFWFVTELVNYIALLPVILSAPLPQSLIPDLRSWSLALCTRKAVPVLALAASGAFAMMVGGPGAIAFAVPALLWCSLAYSVFVVSLLAFVFNCWSLIFMCAAYLPDVAGAHADHAMVSMRLAVFMIAMAPITLSIVMRSREELASKLSLARQRADLALDAGGIVATWELDLTDSDVTGEGKFPQLFDVGKGRGLLHGKLAKLIHSDDRERVYGALGAAIATGSDYRCQYRVTTPAGEIRRFAAFGKPMRDKNGAASCLAGILIDITEQTEAVEALEQSNRRFNIVSESIPEIVWSTDAQGQHDYFNCRWTEFTGIATEDILPETWKELVHPDDKPRVDETWKTCLATGETYSIDYRFRYRDGSYRWLKVLAKPLRNPEGAITRWYGTSTDIDDAKHLEAEREIVARELDHRIGNLFALVNALVRLTAYEASDVAAVTEALQGRLKALHDAHRLIRRNQDRASTTTTELLRRLLAPYDTGGDRITITGDDLPVDSTALTPIALIFHELATNAVKYGALSDGEGRLRIELSHVDDRCRIRWLEVVASQPSSHQGAGLGSQLFDAIVEGQLQGKATRSASHEGLTIEIDLPVSSLSGAAGK